MLKGPQSKYDQLNSWSLLVDKISREETPLLRSHHKIRYYEKNDIKGFFFPSWNNSEQLGAGHCWAPVKTLHAQQVCLYYHLYVAICYLLSRFAFLAFIYGYLDQRPLSCQLWKHIQKILVYRLRRRNQL